MLIGLWVCIYYLQTALPLTDLPPQKSAVPLAAGLNFTHVNGLHHHSQPLGAPADRWKSLHLEETAKTISAHLAPVQNVPLS